jgi:Beta-lactamase enzyme family
MGAVDPELAEIERRWRESAERSRGRRTQPRGRPGRRDRPGRRPAFLAGCLGLAFAAAAVGLPGQAREAPVRTAEPRASGLAASFARSARRAARQRVEAVPSRAALRKARVYCREAGGIVAFAVVDSQGRLRGRARHRRFPAASVVKAMLLAAELRRLERADAPVDGATKETLEAMIAHSDNDSADTIYYRVGDEGLHEVAEAARMRRFDIAGYWGNAQITAADMARFFSRLGTTMPRPYRRFGKRLLGSIVPDQRWGIAAAAGRGWKVRFKGGWRQTGRGSLVHQAAELRDGSVRLSLAVLTDGQPSQPRGIEIVHGVAARLLRRATAPGRPGRKEE